MASLPSVAPAFGQADLSNCEREQIHLAASIQPHGALLVVAEPDQTVLQASANAAAVLRLDAAPLGQRLGELPGDLAARILPHLDQPLDRIPAAARCRVGRGDGRAFVALLHRPPAGGLVVELEPAAAGARAEIAARVARALQAIPAASSLPALADESARLFKELTGYDRVMVYRFDEDGHGEVLAERREPRLEPFLGNRYPASDIPQMARRLYERNRTRVLVDVGYEPVPLRPRLSPLTGEDLDLSLSVLRSMSPIHVQYLKNMGVAATLVASLVVGGRLWGLIACHHYRPRGSPHELRVACELLAEAVATRIAALESFAQAQAELAVRRLEQRMVEAISREGDWRAALFDGSQPLLQPLRATGAALLLDGQVQSAGEVPGTQELREIGAWLDRRPRAPVIATAALGADAPELAGVGAVASGLIAAPISSSPGDYLLWCRPERVRTVTWGGNPFKPVVVGDDPADLSPRRSFARWHQLVEGTSDPWTPADRAAARLIGETVADVVLQFRSVRMLIAQDQLEQVRRQVRVAGQPALIADAGGRVLLTNRAFERLLPEDAGGGRAGPGALEDLADLLAEADAARAALRELLARQRRAWRGEVRLAGDARPLLVRADPVFAAPDRVLGYVVLLSDLSERRAAEAARRRFQEGILDHHRREAGQVRLGAGDDLAYRDLLASVVGNAQLAALEIADAVDPGAMPGMLESIRVSVARTAELLDRLLRHRERRDGDG